jgi:hypothetical protein
MARISFVRKKVFVIMAVRAFMDMPLSPKISGFRTSAGAAAAQGPARTPPRERPAPVTSQARGITLSPLSLLSPGRPCCPPAVPAVGLVATGCGPVNALHPEIVEAADSEAAPELRPCSCPRRSRSGHHDHSRSINAESHGISGGPYGGAGGGHMEWCMWQGKRRLRGAGCGLRWRRRGRPTIRGGGRGPCRRSAGGWLRG